MGVVDQRRVRSAFDGAEEYDLYAGVQRRIAAQLAETVSSEAMPVRPRILEIGCGTGFLTQELLARGVDGTWLITDKAPAMVERCRQRLGRAEGRDFAVLDGEYGTAQLSQRFDLICSSMAMQWFDDLPLAVERLTGLLAPGGLLAFNTLAAGTFREWHAAHQACGAEAGMVRFPAVADLKQGMSALGSFAFQLDHHREEHRDARDFLHRLKWIGAATSRAGHRPLAPRALRNVMQAFEGQGACVTYEVLTCLHRAGGTA